MSEAKLTRYTVQLMGPSGNIEDEGWPRFSREDEDGMYCDAEEALRLLAEKEARIAELEGELLEKTPIPPGAEWPSEFLGGLVPARCFPGDAGIVPAWRALQMHEVLQARIAHLEKEVAEGLGRGRRGGR